jgi:DNA-binding MarR family transcriptional regulator
MERTPGQDPETDEALRKDVERLERLLRYISHMVYIKGREILSDFRITFPQFDALLFLHRDGDMPMGALCDRMSLACSTVTDLVDRMEKGGFVARERDQNDRRVIKVRLLDRGAEMVARVMESRIHYLTTLMKDLAPEERAKIIADLETVYNLIHEPAV